ncbi:hypothetical protein AOLI_G00093920 [Acnodon oligacanthus]
MWSLIIFLTATMTVTFSQTKDGHPVFWPADIFVSPTVKAGEDVPLKCIIFGKNVSINTSPVDAYYAESGVYSLAQGSVVYSLAEHPDVKIDSEQPSSDAVYAKVQKKKKKITHDEFFMYE